MISFLIRMPSHVTISISTSFLTECVIMSKWPYEGRQSRSTSEKQEVVTLADKTSRSPLLRRAFNNTVRVTRCRVNFKLSRREQIWQFGVFSFVNTVVEVEDPLHRHTHTVTLHRNRSAGRKTAVSSIKGMKSESDSHVQFGAEGDRSCSRIVPLCFTLWRKVRRRRRQVRLYPAAATGIQSVMCIWCLTNYVNSLLFSGKCCHSYHRTSPRNVTKTQI